MNESSRVRLRALVVFAGVSFASMICSTKLACLCGGFLVIVYTKQFDDTSTSTVRATYRYSDFLWSG